MYDIDPAARMLAYAIAIALVALVLATAFIAPWLF